MKTIEELQKEVEVLREALMTAVNFIEFSTSSRGGGAPDLKDDPYTIRVLKECEDALFSVNKT